MPNEFSLSDLDKQVNTSKENNNPFRPSGNPRRTPTVDSIRDLGGPVKPSIEDIKAADESTTEEVVEKKVKLTVGAATGNSNADSSKVKTVNPFDIAPPKPQESVTAPLYGRLMDDLDSAVEREKKKISELQKELIEEGIKEAETLETEAVIDASEEESAITEDEEEEYMPVVEDDRERKIKVMTLDDNIVLEEDAEITPVEEEVVEETIYEEAVVEDVPEEVIEETVEEPVAVEQPKVEEKVVEEEKAIIEDEEEDTSLKMNKSFEEELDIQLPNDDEELSEEDAEDDELTERSIEDMKASIKSIITPIKKKLDLSKFSIAKKPISVNDILREVTNDVKTVNWVLPNAGTCEVFTPLSATDIMNLDPNNHTKNRLNTFRAIYKVIYDHIVTPGKPDFEKWLRTTLFHDNEHLYFGLFLATFRDSAFNNPTCPKRDRSNPKATGCGYQFVSEHQPMDYVKFKDDDAKAKFNELMNKETFAPSSYEVSLYQISDEYAFAIRMPSIYNVILETASLQQDFLNKFNQLLDVISYIEDIYYIDTDKNELLPIKFTVDKKSQPKTTVNKLRAYFEIYKKLTPDQQAELEKCIRATEKSHDVGITYINPESICPECGNKIPETPMNPQQLLFTRHQLGRLASI